MRTNHLRGPLTYMCHFVMRNVDHIGEGLVLLLEVVCCSFLGGIAIHCLCNVSHQGVVLVAVQVVEGGQIKQTA